MSEAEAIIRLRYTYLTTHPDKGSRDFLDKLEEYKGWLSTWSGGGDPFAHHKPLVVSEVRDYYPGRS